MSIKVATILAQGIIKELEQGIVPWDKAYSDPSLPYNTLTDKTYQGFNAFTLMFASLTHGSNRYLGLKQAQGIGGSLKDGEYKKGVPIYCPIIKKFKNEKTGEETSKVVNFCFNTVYSINQFTGLDESKLTNRSSKRNNPPIEAIEEFIRIREPKIVTGPCPCYIPSKDIINMPERDMYNSAGFYYSTLLHEIGHWTGAKDRMNRVGIVEFDRFGSEKYGLEELIAEMFSFFARHKLGIEEVPESPERKNRLAYIKGWIDKLKAEPQILIHSAGSAEKALTWYTGENKIMEVEGEDSEEVA